MVKLIGIGNSDDDKNEIEMKIINMIKIMTVTMMRIIIVMKIINMEMMMIRMMVIKIKIKNMMKEIMDIKKVEYIGVNVQLVSRRGGSLNWTWTPPSSSRRK